MFDPAAAGAGQHTITYTATGGPNCESTCTFQVVVSNDSPPVVICDEFTTVALGADCMALVDAEVFNNGSYSTCGDVFFKVRRMAPNACQPEDRYHDQVKFCSTDIGQTIDILMRVYDVPVPAGEVALNFEQSNASECLVEVMVQDKLKPTCTAPGHAFAILRTRSPSPTAAASPIVSRMPLASSAWTMSLRPRYCEKRMAGSSSSMTV